MKNLRLAGMVVSVLAACAGVMLFRVAKSGGSTSNAAGVSTLAPSWELKDADGKPVKSGDFAGKVVILDFWATWCGPCRREIPGFIELQRQYADKGLVVIGVSLDQDGAAEVQPFMDKTGINYPVVLGNEGIVNVLWRCRRHPDDGIIDRNGQIVRKHVGFTEKAEFEKEIKPLLRL